MVEVSKMHKGRPVGSQSFEPKSAIAFGKVLRLRRTSQGYSQEALAHMADMERAHVGRIERGENQPSLWIILKLAKSLHCDAGELLQQTLVQMKSARG
jgi:XRE family transcriptional regulator, regulator of sulfur utilization